MKSVSEVPRDIPITSGVSIPIPIREQGLSPEDWPTMQGVEPEGNKEGYL